MTWIDPVRKLSAQVAHWNVIAILTILCQLDKFIKQATFSEQTFIIMFKNLNAIIVYIF